jgi:TRAP transporter 4TM/12TM fusion protein
MSDQKPIPAAAPGTAPPAGRKKESEGGGLSRFNALPPVWKGIFIALTLAATSLFIIYTFSISFLGPIPLLDPFGGRAFTDFAFSLVATLGLDWSLWTLEGIKYYYLLYVVFMLPIFIGSAARKADKKRLPWYDIVLGVAGTGIAFYFFQNTDFIGGAGQWQTPPNATVLWLGIAMLALSIEAGRRVGGWVFIGICLAFGSYPLFASYLPDPFYGVGLTFPKLVGQFAFSTNGIIGLPAQVNGDLVIGYLLFSGVMAASGTGKFFLDMAMALMGRFRGGPAKVAVVSSALFGTLSGSGVANLVFTGSVTIPAMKKLGYPPHYAGAIEACASTGGAVTPPVMGTIAFIMAILTGIDYSIIVIAAAIPALMYYFGLIIQVDGYAARVGLTGMKKEDIPSIKGTLNTGWILIVALGFLVWALVAKQWTAQGPVFTAGILVGYSCIAGLVWWLHDKGQGRSFFGSGVGRFLLLAFPVEHRMNGKKFVDMAGQTGGLMAWMVAILLPVGLIILGLNTTGTIGSLISRIILIGESNSFLILLVTFIACYLMGMIGLALIPYIFLAVTMAPAVVNNAGLDIIAVHLFLVYCTLISAISPPVAMMAFVGASLAGAPAMKTALMSMRLGIVLCFIPFFFVYYPALLFRGPDLIQLIWLLPQVLIGIWVLTSGLEGYMLKLGALPVWSRPLFIVGGFLLAMPWWAFLSATIGGSMIVVTAVLVHLIRKKKAALPPATA